MDQSDQVPEGSVYLWCYSQGLKHNNLIDIQDRVTKAGKVLRQKDIDNYWRGWYKRELSANTISMTTPNTSIRKYEDFPDHPYINLPEVEDRWVPCSAEGRPLISWSKGCMSKIDAECYPRSCTLAENVKGTKFIVIDCDGDHSDDELDCETIEFLSQYTSMTHTLSKPKYVWEYELDHPSDLALEHASFHLTFRVDKIIPTMHFSNCHIDIIGNQRNSIRYLKNKEWNGKKPALMTPDIWNEIMDYIRSRDGIKFT